MIGWTEILVILLVVVILFGSKRIPEIARALGRASFEFKKAKQEIAESGKELLAEAEDKAAMEERGKNGRNAEEKR